MIPIDLVPGSVVEVNFRLSGYRAKSFGMGGEVLSPDTVRLPFGAPFPIDAAKADVFRVRQDMDGTLWAEEKLKASGYCAIRVEPDLPELETEDPIAFDAEVNAILDKFANLGVTGIAMFGLAVVDIPPEADLSAVRRLLDEGKRDGWWDYVELCVTDAWKSAASW